MDTATTPEDNRRRHPGHDPLPRHVLGIWAHPDDECYLSAGLMARMADAGRPVTVLTATRGEQGHSGHGGPEALDVAALREAELRASLAVLGVGDVRLLDLRDGACILEDDADVIATIGAVMDAVGPDVVLTFGPDGITGHPDHRMVSRWVTEAWRRSRRRPDLLYATMTDRFLADHAELHDRIGLFGEFGGRPHAVAEGDVALAALLSEAELDRKRAALAAHGSQTRELAGLMGEEAYRRWWAAEWFRRPTGAELLRCELVARPRAEVPA